MKKTMLLMIEAIEKMTAQNHAMQAMLTEVIPSSTWSSHFGTALAAAEQTTAIALAPLRQSVEALPDDDTKRYIQ